MISTLFSSLLALLLPPIVILLATTLSLRTTNDRENLSPFECGFDPQNTARSPFSLRFFLLAVIFLIFDIELALLLPAPLALPLSSLRLWNTSTSFIFIILLIYGLFHEWREGSLSWSN